MVKVWRARETTVRITTALSSVETTSALDAQVSTTDFQGYLKNVTIAIPEGSVDKIDLLGETNGFQNAELDEKPYGLATISGTLVHPGDEVLETYYGGSSGTAVTGGYTRYQYGDSTATKTRQDVAILVNLDDGSQETNHLLNNAKITKLGDVTISGADSHWEQSFEAVCLPKDYYVEYKD